MRYLEKNFPNRRLIYKPHPIDIVGYELNNIEVGEFEIYRGGDIAELFLLERINEVEACFSISSTSLRKALDLDIPSYYFLNLYSNYSEDYFRLMIEFTHNAPEESFINNFEIPPIFYNIKNTNLEMFNRGINKIIFYKYVSK